MNRVSTFVFLVVACGVSASRADIIYSVIPETLSGSGGYSLSGFIKTDGTLGPLNTTNIVDYEINVTGGSFPYQFTPMNPGASISISAAGVLEADTSSLVNIDIATGNPPGSLTIQAVDGLDVGCSFAPCEQTIRWKVFNGPTLSTIEYDYEDDIGLNALALFEGTGDSQQLVASVPEPSAFMFLSLVGFVGVGTRWWQNRRTQV